MQRPTASLAVVLLVATSALAPLASVSATTTRPKGPALSQLQAYLATSSQISHMPDLRKTIPPITEATAQDEQPWPLRSKCALFSGSSLPRDPASTCAYGDTHVSRTILLFGDSHASMLAPALDVVGRTLHWRVVEVSLLDCAPWLDPVTVDITGNPNAACRKWRHNVVSYANRTHPAVVMPVGTGGDYGRDTLPTTSELAAEMSGLFRALHPSHAKVVLVGPTPSLLPENALDCLAAKSDPRRCERTVKQATDRVFLGAITHAATVAHLRVTTVFSLFCSNGECPEIAKGPGGNRLVYFDDEHVFRWYASWVGTALAQLLRPAL